MFLGYLDGLKAQGWEPDLIISTCGGAFASLAVMSSAEPEKRLDLLRSDAFHKELLQFQMNSAKTSALVMGAKAGDLGKQANESPSYLPLPRIFEKNDVLMWVPFQFGVEAAKLPFTGNLPKSIVVGSRLLYGPKDVGKSDGGEGSKWYRENYVTDEDTAKLLDGRPSDIAALFPKGAVDSTTETRTGWTQGEAARMSVSDLYYMQPLEKDGQYFAGGFINLFPLELAMELGDEVVAIRSSPFSGIEDTVIKTVFGYSGNERMDHVMSTLASSPEGKGRVHWLEVAADIDSTYEKWGMNPQMSKGNIFLASLKSGIPQDLEEYRKRVNALYAWGKSKGLAVKLTPDKK